ncbi:unnamed protein product (macronuclear) [Paramecium tetraurelia]|uniref:Uncharacterized protein n=1 Tax=Paramecium tetraurelia TaxID=5888 RepID=A0BDI1_PARTE|nr:uncharacterized protein GSPATT00027627001 [Paramecium tetraurelia]CAK56598.1 unnamed protein product [Paramecium tetraurelia]|eukprot:XP_001423996.1 hypothetical protein (macronuclear) [Paramecium tetraurelia strain d4-2]
MGSQPNKNMKNQKDIDLKAYVNNQTRPRSIPICPYNPYFFQQASLTQYNVTINNVLFQVVNPPEDNDSITMAENFDEV